MSHAAARMDASSSLALENSLRLLQAVRRVVTARRRDATFIRSNKIDKNWNYIYLVCRPRAIRRSAYLNNREQVGRRAKRSTVAPGRWNSTVARGGRLSFGGVSMTLVLELFVNPSRCSVIGENNEQNARYERCNETHSQCYRAGASRNTRWTHLPFFLLRKRNT